MKTPLSTIKKGLILAFVACLCANTLFAEAPWNPKWSEWHFVENKGGVTLEYRIQGNPSPPDMSVIAWRARNKSGKRMLIEIEKSYTADKVVTRKETCTIADGKVYDPSPDFVKGKVTAISATMTVSGR